MVIVLARRGLFVFPRLYDQIEEAGASRYAALRSLRIDDNLRAVLIERAASDLT